MRRRSKHAVLEAGVEALEQRVLLTATVGSTSTTNISLVGNKLPTFRRGGRSAAGRISVDLTNSGAVTERGPSISICMASPDGLLDGSQTTL